MSDLYAHLSVGGGGPTGPEVPVEFGRVFHYPTGDYKGVLEFEVWQPSAEQRESGHQTTVGVRSDAASCDAVATALTGIGNRQRQSERTRYVEATRLGEVAERLTQAGLLSEAGHKRVLEAMQKDRGQPLEPVAGMPTSSRDAPRP